MGGSQRCLLCSLHIAPDATASSLYGVYPMRVLAFWTVLAVNLCAQEMVDVPQFRNIEGATTVYGDVLSHSADPPFGDAHGRSTNTHETAHGIAAWLRMRHYDKNNRINAVYYGSGKGILWREPSFKLQDVAQKIPASLRSYRYPTYFQSQIAAWNDTPTYVLDEWVAYIWGGQCAVDDKKRGINNNSDAVSGCLDFSIYAASFCMVLAEKDGVAFQQYKIPVKNLLGRAERTFFEGKNMFPSEKQELLLQSLRQSPDAAGVRKFLMQEFDGAFVVSKENP